MTTWSTRLLQSWHCASGLGGVSDGPAPRKQSCARRRPAAIGVIRCRLSASRLGTVTAIKAIVRQDHRRPSNGATGGGWPLLLPDAVCSSAGVVAALVAEQ